MTVFDTITETTTITIRENENGDTLRLTQVTDKTKATTRDRYHDVQEKVVVKTDTVYVEKEAEKTVAAVGPNTEIDEQGNVTKKVNRVAQTLKWGTLLIVAIIALIIIIRLKIIK